MTCLVTEKAAVIRAWIAAGATADAPEPEPPAPVAFDESGTMRLDGFEPRTETDDAVLEPVRDEAYAIRCGPSGRCIASWRRRVMLARGDYVLRAVVTTRGVEPLDDERGRGAGVRVAGAGRANAVAGDAERRKLFHAFTVEEDQREVELVAELRATAGEADFDAAAFTLHRLAP